MEAYKYYMQRCEELAQNAALKGNTPVGAMIIKEGSIISEAEEAVMSKNDITCHAEIEAIRIAIQHLQTKDLSQCILISTHEPCIMCSYVIRFHKIKKVIYKNPSSHLGGISSSMPLLLSTITPPHWGKPPEVLELK